jgi:hypothetical protein
MTQSASRTAMTCGDQLVISAGVTAVREAD